MVCVDWTCAKPKFEFCSKLRTGTHTHTHMSMLMDLEVQMIMNLELQLHMIQHKILQKRERKRVKGCAYILWFPRVCTKCKRATTVSPLLHIRRNNATKCKGFRKFMSHTNTCNYEKRKRISQDHNELMFINKGVMMCYYKTILEKNLQFAKKHRIICPAASRKQ